jgi:hypothetical protein
MSAAKTNAAGERYITHGKAIRVLERRMAYIERQMLAKSLVGEPFSFYEEEVLATELALRVLRPQKDRLEAIRQRIHELQLLMAARGPADPSIDLVTEHRDLVRERNALQATKGSL